MLLCKLLNQNYFNPRLVMLLTCWVFFFAVPLAIPVPTYFIMGHPVVVHGVGLIGGGFFSILKLDSHKH